MARFTYQAEEIAPARVSFQNQSEKATTYFWDFGDGTTATDSLPSHRYFSSGNYVVSLTAQNGKKKRTIQQTIQIKAPEQCLVWVRTSLGDMILQLYDSTPQHRDNFLKLTQEGYYDSLLFHRVIDGFMIQGGDPNSRGAVAGARLGSGGPGYQVPAEFVDTLVHIRGSLAAARTGDQVNPEKKSSGSQFYIVQGRPIDEQTLNTIEARTGIRYSKANRDAYLQNGGTPQLDHNYTVFGRVIEGFEVIDRIAKVAKDPSDRPIKDVVFVIRIIN